MDVLQPTHLIFILVVALLVLGPKRLPEVGRSLGRGLRDFRGALSGLTDPDEDTSPSEPTSHVTPVTPVTPATTALPGEDVSVTSTYSDVTEHPLVAQPSTGEHAFTEGEQAGSTLLPHVEPDEPQPMPSATASPRQD